MIELKLKLRAWSSLLFFVSLIASCTHEQVKLENDIFSIEYIDTNVTDNRVGHYSGYQLTPNGDTLHYNIGMIVHNLSERLPKVVYVPFDIIGTPDSSNKSESIIFTTRKNFDLDRYRRQNVFWEQVNGLTRKYTFPIDTSRGGMVGLYIDSILVGENGIVQFNAFIERPHRGSYISTLEALKTIRLKPIKPYEYYVGSTYVY